MTQVPLHEDFSMLSVEPGEMDVTGPVERFGLVNLLAFGGAPDRTPHVPAQLGELANTIIWESTGASDALPFWNTNYASDVYLALLHGEVRVEFKEPEREVRYGHYLGRTGDLLRLPRGIAHRTFSTNGRRRISLELLERNPFWADIGRHAGVQPATGTTLGGFTFEVTHDEATVRTPSDVVVTPPDFLRRGLGALVAYELHLDHNEFEGGFVVHDRGERTLLKTPEYQEEFDNGAVLALFKAILAPRN